MMLVWSLIATMVFASCGKGSDTYLQNGEYPGCFGHGYENNASHAAADSNAAYGAKGEKFGGELVKAEQSD